MADSQPNLRGELLRPLEDCCRLCASKPQQKCQIFPKKAGVSGNLHFLIEKYTEIDVRPDDGLPQIICRNCQRGIINIEEKVDSLRKTAKKAREKFLQGGTAQKRCIDEKDKENKSPSAKSPLRKKNRSDQGLMTTFPHPVSARSLEFTSSHVLKTSTGSLPVSLNLATAGNEKDHVQVVTQVKKSCNVASDDGVINKEAKEPRNASEIILSAGVRRPKVRYFMLYC